MATGVSHHISPYGDIEPCPIIQFAKETIHDRQSLYQTMTQSEFLRDFRRQRRRRPEMYGAERPDLVRTWWRSTARATPRSGRLRCRNCWRCSRAGASIIRATKFLRSTGCTGLPRSIGSSGSSIYITETETPMQIPY